MDKDEIKRRMNKRIDEDDHWADQVSQALDTNDDSWLERLILEVIGVIVQIGSDIWNWVSSIFR